MRRPTTASWGAAYRALHSGPVLGVHQCWSRRANGSTPSHRTPKRAGDTPAGVPTSFRMDSDFTRVSWTPRQVNTLMRRTGSGQGIGEEDEAYAVLRGVDNGGAATDRERRGSGSRPATAPCRIAALQLAGDGASTRRIPLGLLRTPAASAIGARDQANGSG